MTHINFIAVLVSALAALVFGGLWYSPALFLKTWLKVSGVDSVQPHTWRTYFISFLLMFVAATVFAFFLGENSSLRQSLFLGVMSGLAWSGTSLGINYAFSGKSFRLWLIDTGYHVGQFTLYGLILGLWHSV